MTIGQLLKLEHHAGLKIAQMNYNSPEQLQLCTCSLRNQN